MASEDIDYAFFDEDASDSDDGEQLSEDSQDEKGDDFASFTEKEYAAEASDSSEDEDGQRNRIGNVPLEWYKDYEHIGYDISGKKIGKSAQGDSIDQLLARKDDPNFGRTIYDALNDRKIVLTDHELNIINRIRKGKYPSANFDPTADLGDFYSRHKQVETYLNVQEPKRRFIPSKWEHRTVLKMVNAIRNGWLKTKEQIEKEKKEKAKPEAYMLWTDDKEPDQFNRSLAPPKMKLPGHSESYNPPPEYLPSEEEIKRWEELDPSERRVNFIPKRYTSLLHVPAYENIIKERFDRCLDLYLCPRTRAKKAPVDLESLIPKLPKPAELKPFPTMMTIEFIGHTGRVRSVSVSPDGQWLATGSDDRSVRVWEVSTGRCFRRWDAGAVVDCVAWNPNKEIPCLLVAAGDNVLLLHTQTAIETVSSAVETLFRIALQPPAPAEGAAAKPPAQWTCKSEESGQPIISTSTPSSSSSDAKISRVEITMTQRVRYVTWHAKGDYFASVCPTAGATSVVIHRLSKATSQAPFKRAKTQVSRVAFHPTKPLFTVASQRGLRVYHLLKQQLVKRLNVPGTHISSISMHSTGDHMVMGTLDRRLCWYDLEVGGRPYKTLRYHTRAIRSVAYHRSYPLFASASDDGSIHVFHGQVYADMITPPMIVPVKILRAHEPQKDLGALDVVFHPTQPWLFSAGADKVVRLFT